MSNDNMQDRHERRNQFLDILKKVALTRDHSAQCVEMTDYYKTLSFFDVEPFIHDESLPKIGAPATPEEFEQLIVKNVVDVQLALDPAVKQKVTRILQLGIPLRYPLIAKRHSYLHIHAKIKSAVQQIPGQNSMAQTLAMDLYSQLLDDNRNGASHALIHGDTAWGSHEVTRAIASVLANELGYQVLEIDCSAYRSEGEAASWTGSKSYWSGSGPGEVTAFIHNAPRAVICFHNLDETVASVMATLRPALKEGVLIDAYGFSEERGKGVATPVNCKEAVFLFNTGYGTHWMTHPHASTILGTTPYMQKFKLLDYARRATRIHRGERQPIFDSTLLNMLSTHHHTMKCIEWEPLIQKTATSLHQAIDYASKIGVSIELDSTLTTEEYAALALLQYGANMQLAHTTPQAIYRTLLQPILSELISNDIAHTSKLIISQTNEARSQLREIVANLGENPGHSLKRRNQYLDCRYQRAHNGIKYQEFSLRTAHQIEDYEVGGLICSVPNENLDDIHGHQDAKNFLRDCAALLAKNSFIERGIKPPRGALLHGEPGTGKTMLARALAGEAQLPFITVTGTMLLDPDVTQKIYAIANRATPCIIHIDEADALSKRGTASSAHDAAVNMLLAKIDGFETSGGIFHVLTTNHPENLDDALLRPGRIDHQFEIGTLDYSARTKALASTWSMVNPSEDTPDRRERILQRTYSMTGADLSKVHRELVLRSIKENTLPIPFKWLDEEIYRSTANKIPDDNNSNRQIHNIAAHEAGHALMFTLLFPDIPIEQLSIIQNKNSAGHLAISGKASEPLSSAINTMLRIQVLMAGRAAEKMVTGFSSGGDQSDLEAATRLAWLSITEGGADEEFGPCSLAGIPKSKHSDAALELAFERAREWVSEAESRCVAILGHHRQQLDALINGLLDKEILSGEEVVALIRNQSCEAQP